MISLHSLQATAIHDMFVAFLAALSYPNECIIITALSITTAPKIEPHAIYMGVIPLKVGRLSWI